MIMSSDAIRVGGYCVTGGPFDATNAFKLDGRPLTCFCFFAAANIIPCAYLSFVDEVPGFMMLADWWQLLY